MSAINVAIVREYFELLGFLVREPCKYLVPGRDKKAEEAPDLVIHNPLVTEQRIPELRVWTTSDLSGICRAVVGVGGRHTERFWPSKFEQTPEVFKFAERAVVRVAGKSLGSGSIAKILCLPELPASDELKKKTLAVLKEKGIDGILRFGTILQHLIAEADAKKNYEKSYLLQLLRILKSYNLFRSPQLELFEKKQRKKRVKKS